MRNALVLLAVMVSSSAALAGGFAAPVAAQITTFVPPPILFINRVTAPASVPAATPTAKDVPDA